MSVRLFSPCAPFLLAFTSFCALPVQAGSPQQNAAAPAPAASFGVGDLRDALSKRRGGNNDELAQHVRAWIGADKVTAGAARTDKSRPGVLLIAWVIEVPGLKKGEEPRVVSQDGSFTQMLTRLGKSDLYAAAIEKNDGLAMLYAFDVKGEKRGGGRFEEYPKNPEDFPAPNVPKGTVTQMPPFLSKVFDGTTRDWWVYVPAQYKAEKPAAVMVFQDGGGPRNWAPVVLDNMIARGEIPPTVGIFINPGTFVENKRSNRSFEYDTLSDAYARFLLDEILPEVEKTTKLTHDPEQRVIYGVSSGGICAFTVAWEHPNEFRKVFTVVGSFTNLQGGPTGVAGGNTYPAIIRRSRGWDQRGMPKPLRIFMTDGSNDLDNAAGSWPLANLEMDRALTYANYDHKLIFGTGFHSDAFGRYHFPDGLRWLWRTPGIATPPKPATATR